MVNQSRLPLVAAAVAMMIVFSSPTMAASSARAVLGPLKITLLDLDESDGITPTFTLNPPNYPGEPYGSRVQSYAGNSYTGQYVYGSEFGVEGWSQVSTSSAVSTAFGSASLIGDGGANGSMLMARGTAFGAVQTHGGHRYQSDYSGQAYAPNATFSLTNNTWVLVSAEAELDLEVTAAFDPSIADWSEMASGGVGIWISGSGGSGNGNQSSFDHIDGNASSKFVSDPSYPLGGYWVGSSFSSSKLLAASFVNVSGASMGGSLDVSASVGGNTYAPVPEPSTLALLFAGLGFLLVAARGRHS